MTIDEALAQEGDVDDILRAVVKALVEEGGCSWAAICFSDNGQLVVGPEAGEPDLGPRVQVPVVYDGTRVAELVADGGDRAFLEGVAPRIAELCLVGWDTGGIPWDSVS